jgi:hypothetical protein
MQMSVMTFGDTRIWNKQWLIDRHILSYCSVPFSFYQRHLLYGFNQQQQQQNASKSSRLLHNTQFCYTPGLTYLAICNRNKRETQQLDGARKKLLLVL